MSNYTTQLRFICEQYSGAKCSVEYSKISEIIESARSKIFDRNYPIFDEKYRSVLETKILEHYYLKEIGYETVALWKFALNRRMSEVMPYYNKLYESEKLEFNPFDDTHMVTEYKGKSDGTTTNTEDNTTTNAHTRNTTGINENTNQVSGTGSSTNDNTNTNTESTETVISGSNNETKNGEYNETKWGYYNDTPQGGIDGLDFTNNKLDYLTDAITSTTNSSDNNTTMVTNDENINVDKNVSGTIKNESENNYSETNNITGNYNEDETTNNNTTEKKQRDVVATNTDEYITTITGKQGGTSYSQLLKEYRDSLINIDMLIIGELKDLFITLW